MVWVMIISGRGFSKVGRGWASTLEFGVGLVLQQRGIVFGCRVLGPGVGFSVEGLM